MKKLKRLLSLVLAMALLLSLAGCDGEELVSGALSYQWIDSDLFENIDKMAQSDIKNDYAANVNYEWASVQERDFTYLINSFGEAERAITQNKRALLEDTSIQNKNMELLRTADGLFTDWDYRNSIGVEPLKKYLAYIDDIQSLDDVTGYMTDNDKNPFAASLVNIWYDRNDQLDGRYALYLYSPALSLSEIDYYVNMTDDGIIAKEKIENQVTYLLERCGYSESEIKHTLNACFRFESEIVHLDYTEPIDYKTCKSRADVLAMAGSYPLEDLLNHYGITSCDAFSGNMAYLDNLEKLYTQKNVEDMKAYFKVRLAIEAMTYLDRASYDCFKETNLDRTNPFAERVDRDTDFMFFYSIRQTSLTAAMDQEYVDYYFDQDTYDEVSGFVHLLKEKYAVLINANENLSEESKKAVCEKLDKMGENIMRPSNRADFTGVDLIPKEDGGTFLDALCVLNRVRYEHLGELVQMEIEPSFWDIYDGNMSTTAAGAHYYGAQNTIYIRIGILNAPIYSPDAPIEEKLGSFVAAIGHEISHAFDNTNINRDADGKYQNIVSSEELAMWSEVSDRIVRHFYFFEPFEGSGKYDGAYNICGEVIADIEGVRACLMIAKDYEDFDYDLFFRQYASLWRHLNTKSNEMDAIKSDEHPLHYLRINYTLMQFEEFDETYGIEPGDGMYLAPDQRVIIW